MLLKGFWPQVKPAFLAVSLFRWDINVRESAVLWPWPAPAASASRSRRRWTISTGDQVGLVLVVIFAVVVATELVTSVIRARVI